MKLLKTLRGPINILMGFIKDVPKYLEDLYTLPNRLRSLANQLEQDLKLHNKLRTLIIN